MRVLLVTTRYPWPTRRGNQLRTVQMASWLARRHEVTVLAPTKSATAPSPQVPFTIASYELPVGERLRGAVAAALSGRPVQNGLCSGAQLRVELARRSAAADLCVLELVRLEGLVESLGSLPMVVDFVDSLALNFAGRAARDRPWLRGFWRAEARRLARSERHMLARARLAFVVCERDRRAMAEGGAQGPLPPELAERLRVLPLAFADGGMRGATTASGGSDGRPTVVLTGNLGYFPTSEGAQWLAREVWPRVRTARPDALLCVAGSRPAGALRDAVVSAGGRVLVEPPDVGAILAGAAVSVAPLRCGSGVPIKVLEAWRAGVPVVTTSHAAAGTVGAAGEDFLVADRAADFAHAILRLLGDGELGLRLRRGGRARLAEYDEATLCSRLLDAVETLER